MNTATKERIQGRNMVVQMKDKFPIMVGMYTDGDRRTILT